MRLRLGASESLNEDVFGSIWVFPKIGGKNPKMHGENNGKPY